MIDFKLFSEKKVWDQPNPNKGEGNKMSPSQRAEAKRRAKAAGRPYPNLVDNMAAMKEEDGKTLGKPFLTPGGPKKRAVYVKNEKGNTIKVSFGDPNLSIKRDNPERRKSFRARHNCDNPGPRTKARYWSCKYWGKTPVSKMD